MPSTLSLPRAMLRGLAERASRSPIEVIISIFILVTLAYFQLLHAITTSHFFDPLSSDAASLASDGAWPASLLAPAAGAPADEAAAADMHVTSLVRRAGARSLWEPVTPLDEEALAGARTFTVEPVLLADSEEGGDAAATRRLRDSALPHVARALQSHLLPREEAAWLVRDDAADLTAYAFGRVSADGDAALHKQLLAAGEDEALLAATLEQGQRAMPAAKPSALADAEMQLHLLPILSAADEELVGLSARRRGSATTEELRSLRWAAYAVRALVVRFWALIRKADSADIFVMLSAYLLMHGTFINLFLSMRKFGSRFWLGASVLTSCIFGFLCALTTASFLNVTVDPVCLSEALPFLVITVGFEKQFLLTRAVFTHASIAPAQQPVSKSNSHMFLNAFNDSQPMPDAADQAPSAEPAASREESFVRALTLRLKTEPSLRLDAPQPMPAPDVVTEAVERVGPSIVRDYAIEIAVMAVGSMSGVSGLREFCQLAALILIFDCVFLFAFFVAILTVMVEVHRIKIMRGMRRPKISTPPNVDSDDASAPDTALATPVSLDSARDESPERRTAASATPRPLWRRIVKLLLGKVPFEKSRGGRENPVARLKLLLITAFLTLHSFNLVSTLTTQSAITRHHATSAPSLYDSVASGSRLFVPGATSPAVAHLLEQLAKTQPADADIVARVADPLIYVLVDAAPAASATRTVLGSAALNASGGMGNGSSTAKFVGATGGKSRSASSLAVLDSFMSGWTIIVGDPVISKWMSLALAISIFLNAYLLKGIATGDAAVAEGNAAGAAAFAAARMIGAHLDRERAENKDTKRPQDLASYHQRIAAQSQERKGAVAQTAVPASSIKADAALAVRDAREDPDVSKPDSAETTPSLRSAGFVSEGRVERRPFEECLELYAGGAGVFILTDEEIILLAQKGKIAPYALEKILQDNDRAVRIRRALISRASATGSLESSLLPFADYDYAQVIGACCENVVGYMPLPVGIAGPLNVDGQMLPIPMATTEGTLVASTSRGCKALNAGGGVTTVLTQDAMTRGPALDFPSITAAARAKRWVDSAEGSAVLKAAFDSTSRFARLSSLHSVMAGRTLYVRFATSTGDAMGMNMIGKGVEHALSIMQAKHFPEMVILSLSGNYCIDKKPAAVNWIMGRGKSVVAEAVIPGDVVSSVLKTTVASLVNLNSKKNLVGSAMAGSIGGFNAHAANILTAMFLATGQDPAQNVESSMCMTLMEAVNGGKDLLVTCSMPCIEVGTVGGGTALSPQRAMLALLGVAGSHPTTPGANAQRLARIICAAVMAAELSLLGALSAGHLIRAHMAHNRSAPPTPGAHTPIPQTHFPGAMTPLVAPPVESSRGSPTGSLLMVRERRSASEGFPR